MPRIRAIEAKGTHRVIGRAPIRSGRRGPLAPTSPAKIARLPGPGESEPPVGNIARFFLDPGRGPNSLVPWPNSEALAKTGDRRRGRAPAARWRIVMGQA